MPRKMPMICVVKKNKLSDKIGSFMREGKKEEANKIKEEIASYGNRILELEQEKEKINALIKEKNN